MRKTASVMAVLLVVGGGVYWAARSYMPTAELAVTPEDSDTETSVTNATTNTNTDTKNPDSKSSETSEAHSTSRGGNDSPAVPIAKLIPDAQTLKEEVTKNPHAPPPSLLGFAQNMGLKMEPALASEKTATEMMGELEDCVDSSKKTTTSVEALCLSNAKLLMDRYPSLKDRHQKLIERAHPDAVKLSL